MKSWRWDEMLRQYSTNEFSEFAPILFVKHLRGGDWRGYWGGDWGGDWGEDWGGEGEELEMKWVGKMFCGFMMLKFCGSSERVWVGRMVCVGGRHCDSMSCGWEI